MKLVRNYQLSSGYKACTLHALTLMNNELQPHYEKKNVNVTNRKSPRRICLKFTMISPLLEHCYVSEFMHIYENTF